MIIILFRLSASKLSQVTRRMMLLKISHLCLLVLLWN